VDGVVVVALDIAFGGILKSSLSDPEVVDDCVLRIDLDKIARCFHCR